MDGRCVCVCVYVRVCGVCVCVRACVHMYMDACMCGVHVVCYVSSSVYVQPAEVR